MASGIAPGRVLSPATTASHRHGDLSHAGLVNVRSHKGSHQPNDIGYSCQLTAVKTRDPLTSATWPYRGIRCSLCGCLLDNGVAEDGAQRKYTGQLGSTYACSLHLCNLMWEIHFMVNSQMSKQDIRWSVSHDRIAGLSVELAEFTCFWKFTADQVMDFHLIAGSSIFTYY